MGFEGIGASVRRKEDHRFLSGRGNYTDDINRPGQAHAVIVRSDRPHARLLRIDTAAALAAPGVVAVYTGSDLAADGVGGVPCGWQVHSKDGSPMAEPAHPVLAIGKVRHVGDPVAVVIAETRQQARNAAELVVIDYDDLPAVAGVVDALAPGAPAVHDDAPGNLCFDWHIGDKAMVDNAFSHAAHVVTLDLTNNRLVPNAMETRAAIGEFDRSSGEFTLYTTSQNPHVIRLLMGAFVLHIPEHKLRVVAPDVGGGFGSKIYHYAEEAIVTWAAGKLARPVKWTCDRSEAFVSDAHGRDHVSTASMALDAEGRFLALRVSTLANMGAYLSTFAPAIPTYLSGTLLAGVYTTPAIYAEVKAVFTHTVPVDAYRGAGRPESTYLLERLVDVIAHDTGLDRLAIRRLNFIPRDAFPYQTPVALCYDSGDYQATLEGRVGGVRLGRFPGPARGRRPAWEAARDRHLDLRRGVRHRAEQAGGTVGCPGRIVRGGERPRASDGQCHGIHGHAQPWPGARDDLRAVGVRSARRAHRPRRRRTRRHGEDPVRHGHLWQPEPGGRRVGDGEGDGQGDRQGQKDRGPPDGGLGRRHRIQGRALLGRRHGQEEGAGGGVARGLRPA